MFNKWKTTFAVFLFKMSHNSKANVSLGSRQTAFPLSNLVTSLWWKKGKFLRSCLLTLIPLSNMKITTPPSSLEEMLSRVPLPTTSCPVYSQPVSPASHGGEGEEQGNSKPTANLMRPLTSIHTPEGVFRHTGIRKWNWSLEKKFCLKPLPKLCACRILVLWRVSVLTFST